MFQTSNEKKTIEQMLVKTVREMDSRRASQVLDFARWLQTQPNWDEIAEEEDAWETAYMENKEEFREMARQALADLDAGETLEMTNEHGSILRK
jgi:hypothetical protein